ncbi:MAG: hypothetical protein OXB93_03290 [Cytophagales bacterium]|nr:hypothetical protein [Cytophagales bacterium]
MKKRFYLKNPLSFLMSLVLGTGLLYSQSSEKGNFSGIVSDRLTREPISHVHIYTSDRSIFRLSDLTGYFNLNIQVGDTLIFSSLAYKDTHIPILESHLNQHLPDTIWMYQDVLALREIIIWGRNPMGGFTQHRRFPYHPSFRGNTPKYRPQGISVGRPQEGVGLAFEGALTMLANQFNDRYHQWKKLHRLELMKRREEHYLRLLQQQLPYPWVQKHTVFVESEIEDFLRFSKPDLLKLSQYTEYQKLQVLKEYQEKYIAHVKRIFAYQTYTYRLTTLEIRQYWGKRKKEKK